MSEGRRVMVLGIDATNARLVRQWADDGTLPNLRALMDQGVSGSIRGVDGFFIGSTWPSFYTGLDPSGHGLHYLVQLRAGTYGFERPSDRGLVRADPFWRRLAAAGKRLAILDVPLTALEADPNGVQMVEWGGHDSVYGFQAAPPELRDLVLERWGTHPSGPACDGRRESRADFEAFTRALELGVRAKTEITRHVLAMESWDLAMQVFTESHCAGHQLWHLHDASHPAHDPELRGAMGNPLERVYQEIDGAIGVLVEEARRGGRDPLILVVSPHGMDHWFGAQFLLRDILFALGVATPEPGAAAPTGLRLASVRNLLPESLKRPVRALRKRLPHGHRSREGHGRSRLPTVGVDVTRSRCFPHPNGLAVGGIRLNLRGREPSGVLHPDDAGRFCRDLAEMLLEIRDADRGHALVSRVLFTRDLYSGPWLKDLPDLLVEWNDAVPVGTAQLAEGVGATIRATSSRLGLVEGRNEFGRSGENRPEGWFVAAGSGIHARTTKHPASILDFAPTLCRALGVGEHGFEGRVIPELGL